MLSRSRTRSAVVAALCGTAALALLIHVVTVSSGPSLLEEEEEMMDDAPVQEAAPVETTEEFYTALHPVYGRCKNQIKLHQFVGTIQRTCGNIHELNEVRLSPLSPLRRPSQLSDCWDPAGGGPLPAGHVGGVGEVRLLLGDWCVPSRNRRVPVASPGHSLAAS